MSVQKPVKVPSRNITSNDVTSFDGGLDERGEINAAPNTFTQGRNTMVDLQGLLTHRQGLKKWLPSTVETIYQVFPVIYGTHLYYLVADDGRIKYCEAGDTAWTDAGTADTPATLITALTGTNNDLKFTAVQSGYGVNPARGVLGDGVTVAYINAGASKPLVVSVSTLAISVQLATNGGGTITSTASDVMAALNANTDVQKLIVASLAPANTGAGLVTALTATNLASGVSSTNVMTTGAGIITTFVRVLDKVLALNGVDKLRYIDLATLNMVQYLPVVDPTNAPTATATGITASGSFKVFYAISFNSSIGTTAISPILSQAVSKSRSSWKTDGSEYLTIARNNTTPTNATSWNLYLATAAAGGTIAVTDMLLLASGLDLSVTSFLDTGTISINISQGTAPEDNSTDGQIVQYGIESEGRPILWGDPAHPENLYIGGDGESALDFSPTNGGYVKPLNKGTNYYPMSVVGFRNGQGIPSLTVLFSNTQGLSKQMILEQQTVTYGNLSFVVWGVTEQNYGSAGVSSPYAVLNYLGKLMFPSADGIVAMDTQASLQNVLSSQRISDPISETVSTFRNEALKYIVGTAWNNRVMMTVPSRGYSYNNELIIYDLTKKAAPIWYKWDLRCQWIGVVSPADSASFVYVCQDNNIFRLQTSYVAQDDAAAGLSTPFPLSARGTLLGTNQAHNNYVAINQAMFYLQDVIGTVEIGVTYRDREGKLNTKSRPISRGEYAQSHSGNWSDRSYLFSGHTTYNRWSDSPFIEDVNTAAKTTIREPLELDNVIASEAQWFINTNLDNSSFTLRSVSYEGVNIGIKADLH